MFFTNEQKESADKLRKEFANLTGKGKDEERICFCILPFKRELQNLTFVFLEKNEELNVANFIIKILFQNELSFVDSCLVLSYVYKRINMPALTYSTKFDEEKLKLKYLLNDEKGICAADEILNAFFEKKEFFDINTNKILDHVHMKLKANMFFNKY